MAHHDHVSRPPEKPETVASPASVLSTARDAIASQRKAGRLRTRDLVGLLVSHGARAMRQSRPAVAIRLTVHDTRGGLAVRYSYKAG
ncbi:hypothetical protein CSC94_21250 [Zhengella mangrovi]|uniref:Uncharacterized protein n=1 Tax=Zhengella mangrovi TaxID=1982044 RepID=A0A2G1QHQ5_9HYPH|nr:hypothetical protein [Zhengella mangrovi]PHP65056.1 hypothetical protein CSC94_21250 [Zhengella mangrovi]